VLPDSTFSKQKSPLQVHLHNVMPPVELARKRVVSGKIDVEGEEGGCGPDAKGSSVFIFMFVSLRAPL